MGCEEVGVEGEMEREARGGGGKDVGEDCGVGRGLETTGKFPRDSVVRTIQRKGTRGG
jgi:hypothetical protein